MRAESLLGEVRFLSDQWSFVLALLAIIVGLGRVARLRVAVSPLLLPALLLVFRKLALYLPVPGTISSADRVLFWSVQSYVALGCLLLLVAVLVIVLLSSARPSPADPPVTLRRLFTLDPFETPYTLEARYAVLTVAVGVYLLTAAIAGAYLPVTGSSALYLPALCVLGLVKLLLITPLLLPLAWVGLAIQVNLHLSRARRAGREVNKLLLLLLLGGGLVQFGLQSVIFLHTPLLREIRGEWAVSNTPALRAFKSTHDFLGVWETKLPQIQTTGLNVVERELPNGTRERSRVQAALTGTFPRWMDDAGRPLWSASLAVLLAALAAMVLTERVWRGERSEAARAAVSRGSVP